MKTKGYSLVEIIVVVVILALIVGLGYRSLSFFLRQATEISRAAISGKKAHFDKFIGVLNDRLAQAWSVDVVPPEGGVTDLDSRVPPSLSGSKLNLFDGHGQKFAEFGVFHNQSIYAFHIKDFPDGENAQDLVYVFTNKSSTLAYKMATTRVGDTDLLTWKIPPPFYVEAADAAFRDLFIYTDDADLAEQLSAHRANGSGLLQHDLRLYNFNPQQEGFR